MIRRQWDNQFEILAIRAWFDLKAQFFFQRDFPVVIDLGKPGQHLGAQFLGMAEEQDKFFFTFHIKFVSGFDDFHRKGFQPFIRRFILNLDHDFIFFNHGGRNQPPDRLFCKAVRFTIEVNRMNPI